jgi:hypothetical protein
MNPQVYGAELAFWLCSELARQGVATSYPYGEDWGWHIEYVSEDGAEFAVHCLNVDGAKDYWWLSLRRYGRNMFGGNKPPYDEAEPLISSVRKVLQSEASISEFSWLFG